MQRRKKEGKLENINTNTITWIYKVKEGRKHNKIRTLTIRTMGEMFLAMPLQYKRVIEGKKNYLIFALTTVLRY